MKSPLIHPDEKLLPKVRVDFDCPDWKEIYIYAKTFYVFFFDHDEDQILCRLYFAKNFREGDLSKIRVHFVSEDEGFCRYYEAYLLSNFETEKNFIKTEKNFIKTEKNFIKTEKNFIKTEKNAYSNKDLVSVDIKSKRVTESDNFYIFHKLLKKNPRMRDGFRVFGKTDCVKKDERETSHLLFVNCESVQHTLCKGSLQECIYRDIYNQYEIVNYNLTECRKFIFTRFSEEHLKVFDSFASLRNKTDFFLFCFMSVEGGLYLNCVDEKKDDIKIFDFTKPNGFSFHKSKKSNFMFLKFGVGHMFCQYVIDKTLDFYRDKSLSGKVQYDEFMQRHFYVSNITMLDIENVDISSPEYKNYISLGSDSANDTQSTSKPVNFTAPLFKRNIYSDASMNIYLSGNRLKSNQLCSLNINADDFDSEINNDITTHVIRLKNANKVGGVYSMLSKGHTCSLKALFVFLENKACEKNVCIHITKGLSEFYVDLDLKKTNKLPLRDSEPPSVACLWIQSDKDTFKYPQLDPTNNETNSFQKACKYIGDYFYVSNQNRYAYKFYKKLFESTDYRVSDKSNNIDALRNYIECCKELKKEPDQMYLFLRLYHTNKKNLYVISTLVEYCRRQDFFDLCDLFFHRGMDEISLLEKEGGDLAMLRKMRTKFYYEYVVYSAYLGNKNIQKEFFYVANHYEYFSEYSSVLYNLKFYKPALEIQKTVNISEKMLKYDMVFNSSSSSILNLSNLYVLNKRFVNYIITANGQYIFNNQSAKDLSSEMIGIESSQQTFGLGDQNLKDSAQQCEALRDQLASPTAQFSSGEREKPEVSQQTFGLADRQMQLVDVQKIERINDAWTADGSEKECGHKDDNYFGLNILCSLLEREETESHSENSNYKNNMKSHDLIPQQQVKVEPNSIVTVNKCIILNSNFEIMYEKVFETDFLYNRLMNFGAVCEGLEDIRLFCYREQIYFLATMCGKEDLHMALGKYQINQERLRFTKIESEDFVIKNVEKNWSFVNIYDKPYVIYSWYPLNILSLDLANAKVKFFLKRDMPQMFSMARGSTNVIDLDDSNKLCMVHYVDYNNNTKRHYYHGFVLFDNNCLLKAYSAPITFFKQPIEYVLGMSYDVMNDEIVCSVSADDRKSYLCHMNLSMVKGLLIHV